MANKPQKLDKLFEEKLSQHQVKPSQLAWERLESQLPKKQKKPLTYWWAAAAAGILLFVTFSLFQTSDQTDSPSELVAEKTEVTQEQSSPVETQTGEEIAKSESHEENQTSPQRAAQSTQSEEERVAPKATATQEKAPANQLVASAPEKTEQTSTSEQRIQPEQEIPSIRVDRPLIAEAEMALPTETELATAKASDMTVEEPLYKVTIISDGIKDEKDKKFIANLGEKVNKVEGFLGKVPESFGELQDAKNNLFSSLISKRDRASEKP
ncbi:hypothetical protein [Algoriphagus namhaensis]